ncbi:tetrahydromethanopterin S-methyltransferase subunit B [Arthrobacter sp. CAN_A214]|uniref:hypothetical protein n=1 Tax=Arthrobacter sp. CAN_A214 TaxID=2787720 RepID=UPI0018CBD0E0
MPKARDALMMPGPSCINEDSSTEPRRYATFEKITAALVGIMFVPVVGLAIIALLFIVLGINQLVGALRPILGG